LAIDSRALEEPIADRGNQGALPWLSARAPRALAFTRDPEFDTIDTMDLADWVEDAESIL
jgi:hypothetical protein